MLLSVEQESGSYATGEIAAVHAVRNTMRLQISPIQASLYCNIRAVSIAESGTHNAFTFNKNVPRRVRV